MNSAATGSGVRARRASICSRRSRIRRAVRQPGERVVGRQERELLLAARELLVGPLALRLEALAHAHQAELEAQLHDVQRLRQRLGRGVQFRGALAQHLGPPSRATTGSAWSPRPATRHGGRPARRRSSRFPCRPRATSMPSPAIQRATAIVEPLLIRSKLFCTIASTISPEVRGARDRLAEHVVGAGEQRLRRGVRSPSAGCSGRAVGGDGTRTSPSPLLVRLSAISRQDIGRRGADLKARFSRCRQMSPRSVHCGLQREDSVEDPVTLVSSLKSRTGRRRVFTFKDRRLRASCKCLPLCRVRAHLRECEQPRPVRDAAAAESGTTYTAQTPVVDTESGGPWNTSQGDPSAGGEYASSDLLPTFTFGGSETTLGGVSEPNVAVYPAAEESKVPPYPSGVAGTPGPLSGYCNKEESENETGSPVSQPAGSTLPFSPLLLPGCGAQRRRLADRLLRLPAKGRRRGDHGRALHRRRQDMGRPRARRSSRTPATAPRPTQTTTARATRSR